MVVVRIGEPSCLLYTSLGILTLIFLIMLLIFYTLYRREIKVKTESTAKVMGEVVAFDSQNQLLISCLLYTSVINKTSIPQDKQADLVIEGKIGEVFSQLRP